jgi:hypothetical protein
VEENLFWGVKPESWRAGLMWDLRFVGFPRPRQTLTTSLLVLNLVARYLPGRAALFEQKRRRT